MTSLRELQKWLKDTCYKSYTIKELNSLEVLDLSRLGLYELHQEINKLPNLKELYNNQIKSLRLECPELHRLACYGNQFIF